MKAKELKKLIDEMISVLEVGLIVMMIVAIIQML